MAKRRRLKKPFRIALKITQVIGISGLTTALISPVINSVIYPVKAQEISPNFTLKTTAMLQKADITNSKTLKKLAVDNYNIENKTNLNINESKVLVVTPTVVTNPSIENVTFDVIDKSEIEENEVKETENANAVSNNVTETQKKETQDETSSKETTGEVEEKSEDKDSNTTQEETTVEISEKKAQSNSKDEEVSEIKLTSIPEETNQKIDFSENVDTLNTENTTNTTILQAQAQIAQSKTIIPVNQSGEVTDLDEIPEKINSQSSVNGLKLVLTQENVNLTDGSEFVPEDYIKAIQGKTDILPALKIDNPVNSTDGEYIVKYSIVDTDGSSLTVDLKVTIDTSEQVREERKIKTEENINAFVEETTGKHIDEDGYYGDQCWDLWGYFNRVKGLTDFDEGTQPYGYVYGIPLKYKTSGANEYYKYIEPGKELKIGDWLFWDRGSSYADSHVALLLDINEDGTLKCLTQSYGQGTRVLDLQPDIMASFRLKGEYEWWNLD